MCFHIYITLVSVHSWITNYTYTVAKFPRSTQVERDTFVTFDNSVEE